MLGHQVQDMLHQITMRIEQREAFAVHEVLAAEIHDQGGLAGAGLPMMYRWARRSARLMPKRR
ncbi:MAG: hypothetical protein DMG25_04025 [Acidobacteria bacterium]|nr:MAG: hypothetical protein DMG25_04025 [Acidobacteriota bacterium]